MARVNQIFIPGSAEELRDQWLRDFRLAATDAGKDEPPVTPGTDAHMKGTAMGNLALIGLSNISISDSNTNVLTATGDELDRHLEALGLPQVDPAPSSGKVVVAVGGSTTIVNGTQLLLPNGLRLRVVGNFVNPADGAEIDVIAIDTGTDTNLGPGETVRFIAPPTNVEEEATVSDSSPLTGGTDEEDPERKRRRILNALRARPAGGNWSQLREIAIQALGSIVDAFVYPALGGPSSVRVVPVKGFDPDNRDFSRAPSGGALAMVRSAIQARTPGEVNLYVQAATDQSLDVALSLDLPPSALAGGTGQGWLDPVTWPQLEAADSGRVTVSAVGGGGTEVTVTAATSTEPIDTQTHVSWWSRNDQRFYTALVVEHSGSAGAWVLALGTPLVDGAGEVPQTGDFVSPAARNIEAYGRTWVSLIESLGPGENISAPDDRLPRSLRRPFARDEAPASLSASFYRRFTDRHPEISAVNQEHASATTPTVPGTVEGLPSIFVPRHLAIYEA